MIMKFTVTQKCDTMLFALVKTAALSIKGYCTTYPKISIFVLYLKIINTFLINNVCISYELSKKLKNSINI